MSFGQGGPPRGPGDPGQQPGRGGAQQNPQQNSAQGYGYPQQGGGYGYPQQQPQGYGYPPQQSGGGYGYPPQDSGQGYGYPQQNSGGYGYPPQQQAPPPQQHGQQGQQQYGQQPDQGNRWQRPGGDGTPDWGALAEASESRARRRKWLIAGAAGLATVLIGVGVAVGVVSANGDSEASDDPSGKLPGTADIPSDTSRPGPSFEATTPPPPPDPMDYISSAKKDKAPLSPGTLFPGTKLTKGDRVYRKGPVRDTKKCAEATRGELGGVLTRNKCTRMIRAAYTREGVSVTIGVAVFDTAAQAAKVVQQAEDGNIVSLTGKPVGTYCRSGVCRDTVNAHGRYAYFSISGFTSGKDVTKKDREVYRVGDDLRVFTYNQINRRGEAQASAAAEAPQ
ncbi:hypothetical protein ABZ929_02980 [Streptomyces physcomitrii]|uniref:hypothetical protein n=1 Tax=Streptomyces physcomitrii TaxID=2724184 RepID=UPI0033EF4171